MPYEYLGLLDVEAIRHFGDALSILKAVHLPDRSGWPMEMESDRPGGQPCLTTVFLDRHLSACNTNPFRSSKVSQTTLSGSKSCSQTYLYTLH